MERDDIWGNIYGKKGKTALVEKGIPTVLDRMRSAVEAFIDKKHLPQDPKRSIESSHYRKPAGYRQPTSR